MATLCEVASLNNASLPLEGVKVCVLSTIPISTSRIVNRQCLGMVRAGATVTLISGNPHEGSKDKFRMRHFGCRPSAIGRLVSSPAILVPALAERADIYHVHTFQLVPIALVLKVAFRKHVIYDMFEDFPSMVLTRPWRPQWLRSLISRGVHAVESIACRSLDAVITADSSVLRQYVKKGARYRKSRRRMVFYNFPSLDVFFRGASVQSRGAPKIYDIVYSGGMSERTGTFVLLQAVTRLAQTGIRPRVLMFGYSDKPTFASEFMELARRNGIEDCFELLGRLPHEQVPEMLMRARIGVVPLQPIPKFLKNIPTKIFEYWACGLPVVASDLPPIRPFFRRGQYGYLVDPESPEQFAEAVARLLQNQPTAERMGAAARQAVITRLNVMPEQKKLIRLYKQILNRREHTWLASEYAVARTVLSGHRTGAE